MKLVFCFVVIFLQSLKLFSQETIPYGDFIEKDTAIKWAAESDQIFDLTPKTSRFSIKNRLINKLNNEGLFVYIIDTNNRTVAKELATKINYKTFQSSFDITKDIFSREICHYDYLPLNSIKELKDDVSDSKKLQSKIDFFTVKQILYYKNGKINISNVLICPTLFEKHNKEEYLLNGKFLFNACFNNSSDENISTNNLQYIGNFNVEYKFNYKTEFRENNTQIITLREAELINPIMDDFQARMFDVIDIKTNTKVPRGKFLSYNMPMDTVDVTEPESNHRFYEVRQSSIMTEHLNTFKINQDIFWDSVQLKLISKVNEVVIKAPYLDRKYHQGLYTPLYKIVYKKPFIAIPKRDYLWDEMKVIQFRKYVK